MVTEAIKSLIAEAAPMSKLQEQASREGFQTLLHSALNKVCNGMTTLDEALSVCATQSDL